MTFRPSGNCFVLGFISFRLIHQLRLYLSIFLYIDISVGKNKWPNGRGFLVFSFHFRWLDALCPAIAFSETLWMLLPECRLCYLNKTGLYAFCVSFQESLFGVQTTGEVMKIQITYETRVLLDTLGGFYCVPRWQSHCFYQFSCNFYPTHLLWVSLSHLPHFSNAQSLHNSDYLNFLRLSEFT